jgi:ComF family protein
MEPDGITISGWRPRLRGIAAGCRDFFGATARLALDIALPTQCVACRAPVRGEGLCASCWPRVSFIERPYCERLGIPFVYDPGPGLLSMEAIADPPAYSRARAAVRYDDVARTLVHALKYQDRTDLAPVLGRWMARAGAEILADADVVVPVPLYWRRSLARRYNQAAMLAKALGRQARVPVAHDLLRRTRHTEQQVGLSRADRAANVQGAFAVPDASKAAVRGKRIVIVDDVLTSGSTTDACARALLRARASRVDVLVFARVVDRV